MVKVSFNSALTLKEMKKDTVTLLPDQDKVSKGASAPSGEASRNSQNAFADAEAAMAAAGFLRRRSQAWRWSLCLGLALMVSGMLVGGAYLYRYYVLEDSQVFVCGVNYREEDLSLMEVQQVEAELSKPLKQLEEQIRILEREQVALINVPVPDFEDGDPADIVHDFQRGLTAYLDLSLNKCYVLPLNTSVVVPPRDFLELLINIKAGTYLPQSYLVHEEMVVTERLEHSEQLGDFIGKLCRGRQTFKLQRRERILGMQKRQALNCRRIRHFESKFVVETSICQF